MAVVAGYPLRSIAGSSDAPQSAGIITDNDTVGHDHPPIVNSVLAVRLTIEVDVGGGGDGGAVGYPILG